MPEPDATLRALIAAFSSHDELWMVEALPADSDEFCQ